MKLTRVIAVVLTANLITLSAASAQQKSYLERVGASFDSFNNSLGWYRRDSKPAEPVSQRRSAPQRSNTPRIDTRQLNANQQRQLQQARRSQQSAQLQIQGLERGIAQAQKTLDQQLARANQLRANGLKSNDGKLLKQAEQIERQALTTYEQAIKRFETGQVRPSQQRKPAPKKQQPSRRWSIFGL